MERIHGGDVKNLLRIMKDFREAGVKGIALVPTDDELLKKTINEFVEKNGISVITINSDLEDTKRLCFIGQDSYASGRVAGGLMGEIIPGTDRL